MLNSSSRVLVLNSSSSRVPKQCRKGRQKAEKRGKLNEEKAQIYDAA